MDTKIRTLTVAFSSLIQDPENAFWLGFSYSSLSTQTAAFQLAI